MTLNRIFEPYYTTKDEDGGTGLGLAVVHGIVVEHGGAICVQSMPGKGAEFTVFLPALCVLENRMSAATRVPGYGNYHGKVLFVDDEEIIARLTEVGLQRLGYNVDAFQHPRQALESFLHAPEHYDIVISDMTMPGMLGTELIREMRQARPDIPAILCTGYSELIDELKAEALGIDALVMKPVTYQDLARQIAAAMKVETT